MCLFERQSVRGGSRGTSSISLSIVFTALATLPLAACCVKNYHKCSDVKRHTSILSKLCELGLQACRCLANSKHASQPAVGSASELQFHLWDQLERKPCLMLLTVLA